MLSAVSRIPAFDHCGSRRRTFGSSSSTSARKRRSRTRAIGSLTDKRLGVRVALQEGAAYRAKVDAGKCAWCREHDLPHHAHRDSGRSWIDVSMHSADPCGDSQGHDLYGVVSVAQVDALIGMLTTVRDRARAEGAIA